MKALIIEFNGRELERFVLDRPTVFVGRSPSCDIVLRVKDVKPLHYLIEWVGEGQFNPDKGFWTLLDLSTGKKDQARGEGVILSAQKTAMGRFTFGFTEDGWIEKEMAKGRLKKQMDQVVASSATGESGGLNEYCLETVSVRTDSERVEDVTHTTYFTPKTPRWLIKARTSQIKFQWQDPSKASLEFMPTQEKWDIKNRDEFLHEGALSSAQNFEITPRDVVVASNNERQYYIRLVPRQRVEAQRKRLLFDPLLLGFLGIIFLTVAIGNFLQTHAPPQPEAPKEPPRVVTVDLPPPPPPVPVEAEPPPEPTPVVEPTAPVVQPKPQEKPKKPEPVVAKPERKPEPAKPAATVTKNPGAQKPAAQPNTATKPGLPGVLGVLKKGSGGAKPLKADSLIADRPASELDSQAPSAGAVAVARSSPGALVGSKNTGSSQGVDLDSAGTSLEGGFVNTPGEGGISGKDTGTLGSGALAGAKSAGTGKGTSGGGTFNSQTEIEGGLDADAVRRAIREYQQQFRACYENYLTSAKNKNESGRVTLLWVIGPDGKVKNNSVANTTFAGANMGNCIKNTVDKIVFPKAPNGMPTRVRFPFVFQGKK